MSVFFIFCFVLCLFVCIVLPVEVNKVVQKGRRTTIKKCIISTALYVTEGIFAVLYVLIMGLTRFFIKRQLFTFISTLG